MKKLILVLSFLMSWPLTLSWAQLFPLNEAGVTQSAWHTIVRDVEVTKKFWALFGGEPIKIEGMDVIKLPGVLVFLHPGEPAGPSLGAVVDHVGVNSPQPYDLVRRLIAAGVKTDPINPETLREPNWKPGDFQRTWTYSYSPDGLRVEVETNPCTFLNINPNESIEPCPERILEGVQKNDPSAPIGSDMLHFYLNSDGEVKRLYDFYAKFFGGKPVTAPSINVVFPGAKMNIVVSREPRPLNKGRALDSMGFEVKNLEEFCKKLEAAGVTFDQPYSKTRYKTFASAQFTDAAGMPIRLTEGLDRYISKVARKAPPRRQAASSGVAHGREVFEIHCSYCHGKDSNNYRGAPGLKDLFQWPAHHLTDRTEHKEHTVEMVRKIVLEGTKVMPPRGMILSGQELDDLLAYLQTH